MLLHFVCIFLHTNAALPLSKPNVRIILDNTSFTVMWTVPDPNYNYTVIVTNLNTNMTINSNTTGSMVPSYSVPILDPTVNFNASVATVNMCGENRSDPITVFSKSVHVHIMVYMCVCMYLDGEFIKYETLYIHTYVRT